MYLLLGFLCPYASKKGEEKQAHSISPLGFTIPVKTKMQLLDCFKTFHSSPTAINLREKVAAEGRYKMLHQGLTALGSTPVFYRLEDNPSVACKGKNLA